MNIIHITIAIVIDTIAGKLFGVAPDKLPQVPMRNPHSIIYDCDNDRICRGSGCVNLGSIYAAQEPIRSARGLGLGVLATKKKEGNKRKNDLDGSEDSAMYV